jgi:hypothetical protein
MVRVWSISSGVVSRERLNLMAPWAILAGIFMACRTWEGSRLPLAQAAPALAQTPRSLSKRRMASASRAANPMLVVFGR